jgi:hypothetical protein
MGNPFTDHPKEVDETYLQHLLYAVKLGLKMIVVGLCCMVHGPFPFLFTSTTSRNIKIWGEKLNERFSSMAGGKRN